MSTFERRSGRWATRLCMLEPCEPRTLFSTLPSGFHEAVIASGLTSPTSLDVASDGRVFLTDQTGHVRVIHNGSLVSTPVADFSGKIDSTDERGMMGIALDPGFAQNRFVYLFYTAKSLASHNRVSRITLDAANPNKMLAGSEKVLLDLPDLTTSAIWHMGGALNFGADGKLYVCVGDQMERPKAQDPTSVLGKVLRLNADGTIPADNPFYGTLTGNARSIWASGLRNPYTAAIQPGTGRYFINDVGANAWEEINQGVAKANYGWGTTEGPFNQSTYPAFTQPFYAYAHIPGGNAVTGGAFYNPGVNTFGAAYQGKYFYNDFNTGKMYTLDPSSKSNALFASDLSFPVGIDVGNDGAMYVLSRGVGAAGATGAGLGRVLKIQSDAALFGKPVGYATGSHTHGIASADFNNDGKLDIAAVSAGDNRLSVLLGNGDGTFKPAVNYTVGIEPKAVMSADLNGDGKIDLATCSQKDSLVSILLNTGNGTFKPAVNYASPKTTHELALADLDGDKDVDLIAVGAGQSIVRVRFNNGSGVFGAATDYAVGSQPHSVVARDLNGDTKPDLAIANLGSNNLAVLINKGAGAFNAAAFYGTGTGPHSVRAADLNGDGKAELVAAAQGSNALSVLINNGNGTFKTKVNYAVGKTPKNVAIGDVNNDGKLDLVSSNVSSNYPSGSDPAGMTVSVLRGNGNGTFAPAITTGAGNTPFSSTLGDFDKDGDLDLATANWHGNNVTVLKNSTNANGVTPPPPPPGGASITGVTWTETDADGKREPGETLLKDKLVFIDLNRNGVVDESEPTSITNSAGVYTFTGLSAGTYRVARVRPNGYWFTSPKTGWWEITLTANQTRTGVDIGTANRPPV